MEFILAEWHKFKTTGPSGKPCWGPKTYYAGYVITNFCYYTGSIPFYWDKENNGFFLGTSKWVWYRWRLISGTCMALCAWHDIQCIRYIVNNFDANNPDVFIKMTEMGVLSLGELVLVHSQWKIKSMGALMNSSAAFYEKFQDKYNKSPSWADSIGCAIRVLIFFMLGWIPFALDLRSLISCPDHSFSIVFPICTDHNSKYSSNLSVVFWISFQHVFSLILSSLGIFYSIIIVPVIWFGREVINEMRTSEEQAKTISSLRKDPATYAHVYHCLQLLNHILNETIAKVLLPLHLFSTGSVLLLCVYGLIRLEFPRLIQLFAVQYILAFTMYLVIMLDGAARLSVMGGELYHRKHENIHENEYLKKLVASLAPIKYKVGPFFVFTRHTVLSFMATVLDSLVNLLLL